MRRTTTFIGELANTTDAIETGYSDPRMCAGVSIDEGDSAPTRYACPQRPLASAGR